VYTTLPIARCKLTLALIPLFVLSRSFFSFVPFSNNPISLTQSPSAFHSEGRTLFMGYTKDMEGLPGAQAKIQEYVTRIQNGEDKEFVLQGLGPAFRNPVEAQLATLEQKSVPEKVEDTVVAPRTFSEGEIQERIGDDQQKIEMIERELGLERNTISAKEIIQRKALTGWPASYELAKVAREQGVDLSSLTREEYAQYAIDNYLAIDDDQLRAQPWQRNEESVEAIVQKGRQRRAEITPEVEKEFASFSHSMMELAQKDQQERYLAENVRVLSGTKDSNSWLFFSINNGTNTAETDTFKSYFSFKDLNKFSPKQFFAFMETLQKRGYNGGVKIFQDLTEQGTRLNDQVVMHGFSEKDAALALEVAKEFFDQNIGHTSLGKDEIIEGKSESYSKILAQKIKEDIKNK